MSEHQKFFVTGTSCKSCEVVIERALLREEGVVSVDVSHKRRTIDIETDGRSFTEGELTALLGTHGYRVRKRDVGDGPPPARTDWKRVGGFAIIVFAAYYVLSKTGLLSFTPSAAEPAGLAAVFAVGLIASVSSCTAVVGGLVVAVASSVAKEQIQLTRFERFKPHLFFNIGRLAGFVLLGSLIGLMGSAVQLSNTLNGILVTVVAAAMVLIGVNLLELFPAPVIGMPKWLAHKIHDLSESPDPKAPLLLGALTFFLPCGFTQSMQLFALSLQDPVQAGVVMGVFALGTMPALIGIGGLVSAVGGGALRRVTRVAGVFVLVLGISNAANGLTLLGIDPTSAFARSSTASVAVVSDGVQRIQMEVLDRGRYAPDVITVVEGIPVEWTIFGADYLGCANTLILPPFGVSTYIEPGFNVVRFTPTRAGRYTFSCSMGMVRGTMIVTPNE